MTVVVSWKSSVFYADFWRLPLGLRFVRTGRVALCCAKVPRDVVQRIRCERTFTRLVTYLVCCSALYKCT